MPGYWLKLIFLRKSNTQLRSLCLKVLLYTNRLYMKLYSSIALSVMFLVMSGSFALRLLLLKLYLAANPWLRLFKLLKAMSLVDWVLNLLFILLCHRCKPNVQMPYLWFPKGMLGPKLLLNLLMAGSQWKQDENKENRIRERR
jgi:hypothetical protein